jgi:hypothetical protein
MNKKLILPLIIGAGLIGLYFLMKKKKTNLNNEIPISPPKPQTNPNVFNVDEKGQIFTDLKQSTSNKSE